MFTAEDLESVASEEREHESMLDTKLELILPKQIDSPAKRRAVVRSNLFKCAALLCLLLLIGAGIIALRTRYMLSVDLEADHQKLLRPEEFLSDIPIITREYQGDPLLKRLDEVGDEAWLQRVQPDGDGFLVIHDPRRYDIAPSSPTYRDSDPPGSEIYSIAVTHSLHCLLSLRLVFVMRERGKHIKLDRPEHISHCFDYLRFVIQCGGDTGLEAGKKVCAPDDEGVQRCHYHFDPTGSKHVCRDWDVLSQKLESMRYHDTVSARNYTHDFLPKHYD